MSVEVDEDVEDEDYEEEEDDEEVEDDGMDEIHAESRFPRWVPAHAHVPVVPLRELPAGMGVYVRSLGERAACPSSWSRALTFYGPLYLTVSCSCWSCLRCTGLWTVLGDHFRNGFRMLHSLVRQWIHVWRSL